MEVLRAVLLISMALLMLVFVSLGVLLIVPVLQMFGAKTLIILAVALGVVWCLIPKEH